MHAALIMQPFKLFCSLLASFKAMCRLMLSLMFAGALVPLQLWLRTKETLLVK
jgi:hypothetical protein